jgi:hypothetical protein
MLRVTEFKEGRVVIKPEEERDTLLVESECRELLVWFKNNKPDMWREIFCEDCPEVC